ncbi:UNVERIFIED_CONTAM: hypothetical protein GTU68_015207 [Idotea baltica]|nr:hypothetical protein [Idotea baltica]
MIRIIDFVGAFLGLLFGFPLLVIIYIVGVFDTGSPVFSQIRVGKNKQPFTLYKFRTMNVTAESVGTHEIDRSSITRIGSFLRKTKLDELPQFINVLKGEMSLVGPRPGLFNQIDLIKARDARAIYNVRPGITGLSQINTIDMSMPELLAEWDERMIKTLTLKKYFYYIFATMCGHGTGDRFR